MGLSRDTRWRQGSILTKDSSIALELFQESTADKLVIVISHDCDLSHIKENQVEVIVASIVSEADPRFAKARNIRCLHITYKNNCSSIPFVVELTYSGRKFIPTERFSQTANLDHSLIIPDEEKRVLKNWLGARYARPAFPNAFQERLRKKDKKFEQKIEDILEPAYTHLIGVYVDLGKDRSTELPPSSPYFLRISLVYDTLAGSEARKIAENCAEKITTLFHKTYGIPSVAIDLVLDGCTAVADVNFSAADLRKVDKWQTDCISLRETPQGEFLSFAEIPT